MLPPKSDAPKRDAILLAGGRSPGDAVGATCTVQAEISSAQSIEEEGK